MPDNIGQFLELCSPVAEAATKPDPCLSVEETCAYLSIGKTTYNKLRNRGEFETFMLLGKRLTRQSAIDAYIERLIAKENANDGKDDIRGRG